MPDKLTIGLSLSLTGEYAAMARQAEAALRLFVADANAGGGIEIDNRRHELALACIDDQSRRDRAAEIYRALCFEKRAQLILGPYSSALARAAAPIVEEAGMVMVNHGGADDDLYNRGYRMMVGVLTPASEYLAGFVRMLATLKFWRKRVAIISSRSPFARAVAEGIERACHERSARRRGVRVRLKYTGAFDPETTPEMLFAGLRRTRVNALLSAGSYAQDVAMMRLIIASGLNIPVLGCVAAGVDRFAADMGDEAAGIVGPSQWEEQVRITPEIGPTAAEFARRMRAADSTIGCDYPAAQVYAAGLLTVAALRQANSLDQERLRAAFSELRTTTLFGDFAIDRVTGRQIGHKMLLVQWHGGRKMIIDPEAHTDQGELELPAGWRLIAASFHMLRLRFGGDHERDADEVDPDEENR